MARARRMRYTGVSYVQLEARRRCPLPQRLTLAAPALAMLVATAAVASEAPLPPQTRGFRTSRTLRLASVLGSYGLTHAGLIWASAFSPDGARLFSGGADDHLRAWDARTGDELWIARADGTVKAIAVTRGGDVLAATGLGTVGLWDGRTGRSRWSVRGHERRASAIALSADGRHAVSGGSDGRLVVWDVATGKVVRAHGDQRHCLDFMSRFCPDWVWISPEGKLGYFGFDDVTRQRGPSPLLWDLDAGGEANAAQAASAERDLLDAEAYRLRMVLLPPTEIPESRRTVHVTAQGLSLSPDGRRIAFLTSGAGSRLEIWDLDGKGRRLVGRSGHTDKVIAVDVSPDGRSVLSVGTDGSTFVRDLATGGDRWSAPSDDGAVSGAVFADEGRTVAMVEGTNAYSLWWVDAATGRTLPPRKGHPEALGGVILGLSPGARLAVVSKHDGSKVAVRRVARPEVISRLDPRGNVLAVSADGKLLTERDGIAKLFAPDGTLLAAPPADPAARVTAGAISPAGDRVATAHDDGSIRLWDARSAKEIDRIDIAASTDEPTALWLGADGALLAGTARGVVLRFEPLRAGEGSDGR